MNHYLLAMSLTFKLVLSVFAKFPRLQRILDHSPITAGAL